MDICTFNDHYLNPLLEKLSKENDKKVFEIERNDGNISFNVSKVNSLIMSHVPIRKLNKQY